VSDPRPDHSLLSTRSVLFALVAAALGLLIVLLIAAIVQTRGLVGAVRDTQKVNTGTVRLIEDCTKPTGHCFKQGQRRTAQAVLGINGNTLHVIVAALTCQSQGFTGHALATCTAKHAGDH
jgi:hypothetical protein